MTESVEDDPLTEDDYETGDPTSPGVKDFTGLRTH